MNEEQKQAIKTILVEMAVVGLKEVMKYLEGCRKKVDTIENDYK